MKMYQNLVNKLNSWDAQFQRDMAVKTKKVDEKVKPVVSPLDQGISESSVRVSI